MTDPDLCSEGGIHDPSTRCQTCGALQAVSPSRSASHDEMVIREDEISMVIAKIRQVDVDQRLEAESLGKRQNELFSLHHTLESIVSLIADGRHRSLR